MEEKDAIAKIVGILFMSRTMVHKMHLWTPSYAEHVALNGLYDGIVGIVDTLAETAQGVYGKLDIPDVPMKGDYKNPVETVAAHATMVDNLVRKVNKPFIDNIIQEIQAMYYASLYKLKELK